MTRQDAALKWLAYGVMLLVTAVLNYYILGLLPIALPLLLPVAAVAAGTLEGPHWGAGFGLASGLVMATAGHESLLCIPVLSLFGLLAGLIAQYVLRRDLVGHLVSSFSTLLVWELCLLLVRLSSTGASLSVLAGVAVPEFLWSLVFSLPVYWLARFCCVHYGRIYHE